jgi:hypothetical protein
MCAPTDETDEITRLQVALHQPNHIGVKDLPVQSVGVETCLCVVAVAYRLGTALFWNTGDEFGDWRIYLLASVEINFVTKTCHHYAEAPDLFGEGASCELFCNLRMWQSHNVKSHSSPDV